MNQMGQGLWMHNEIMLRVLPKVSFTNYVAKILAFFEHLPSFIDIFCGINIGKKWTFLDHLPT